MLSDTNARLASARRLTSRKGRRETGRFLAEGAQAVTEALRGGQSVIEVFATASARERHAELLAAHPGVAVDEVSERAACSLSETVTPQGLIAVCHQVDVPLATMLDRGPHLVAALVESNDPGNAGTVVRTADAAGANGVVLCGGVDIYNGKAVRASAGSLFHLDVVAAPDPIELIEAARTAGLRVLATTGSAITGSVTTGSPVTDLFDLTASGRLAAPTLWLFGSEAHGLPAGVIAAADEAVRVPILGAAESLNLAAAAAVCLYSSAAARRQADDSFGRA